MFSKNNKQKDKKTTIKGLGKYSSKKMTKIIASVLIGTNLGSLLVGTTNVFALDNEVGTEVNSITEPMLSLNKVTNGEFENNLKSSNQNWDYKAGGKSKLTQENENSYGSIEKGSIDDYILQVVSTTPGKKYTVSADVKVDVPEGGNTSGIFFTAKRQTTAGRQGSVYKELQFTSSTNGWERKEFEFTADTYKTYVGIVKWVEKDLSGIISNTKVSIDNVKVIEENNNTVLWEDDFSGNILDQNIWGYELGNIRGNEQEHYVDSKDNVFLEDGNLILKATDRDLEDQYKNTAKHGSSARQVLYNSGSVRTHGNMEFLYGRIEMKAKLPKGKGAFPAFWTLGADFTLDGDINSTQGYGWPGTGEIDIMELIGAPTEERSAEGEVDTTNNKRQSNKVAYATPHFYYASTNDPDKDGSYSPYELGANITLNEDLYEDFHVFGINWTPEKIEWYVDGVVYNTMPLTGDARLEAAAASLNRPQYIQFNLATGGNWAGEAGMNLGTDDTRFEIDWVRWSQNAEQKVAADAYYSNNPNLKGVKNVTMTQGEKSNLLEGISVDKENYVVDFSIDDEYMFSNAGGNTNVTLKVKNSLDLAGLQSLESGVYNIHYTAVPKGVNLSGNITPTYKVKRETSLLTVLPKGENSIKGNEGDALSSVVLPSGWKWQDETQIVNNESSYKVIFNNIEAREEVGKERTIVIDIPGKNITGTNDIENGDNTEVPEQENIVLNAGNIQLDGTKETAVEASANLQSSIKDVMELGSGTVTFRYRLDESMLTSNLAALMTISDKAQDKAYASFYIRPSTGVFGMEIPGKGAKQVGGTGYNYVKNTEWHTVSYVFNGSSMTVYFDGNKYGEVAMNGLFNDVTWKSAANTITLGGNERKYSGADSFQWGYTGLIDTVKVQDNILSADQIKAAHDYTNRELISKYGLWDAYDEGIYMYRIPSIVKTTQGTLVAASDARKKHWNDWGDVATVVKTSTDDGETWSDNVVVLDLPTQPYYTQNYIEGNSDTQSAFSIDPTLLTDSNGKIYLLVDVFPESQGAINSKAGSGYQEINGKLYLTLDDFYGNKYTVRENGLVYDANGNKTDMYVSEGDFETAFSTKGDLYKKVDGASDVLLGNIYLRSGRSANGITKTGSKTAPLFVHLTSYLWMLTSEDQGQTWSNPVDITGSVKADWMEFIGTGAAPGIEIEVEENGNTFNRLMFPIYYTNEQGTGTLGRQSSANIYSDDGGITWQRGESPNDGRIYGDNKQTNSKDFNTQVSELTENQIVQLNNGHLLQFMRNTGNRKVIIARSTDYGLTWENTLTETELSEPYVNLTAIHMDVEGKEYIVFSNPTAPGTLREKGVLRIGEVKADDSIEWVVSKLIEPTRYAYSSLVQLDAENVGLLFEYDGHIKYSTFNVKELLASKEQYDKAYINDITKEVIKAEGNTEAYIQPMDEVIFTVKTSQKMYMIGERKLDINIGSESKKANYISGNGSDTFKFNYIVQNSDAGEIVVNDKIKNTTIENVHNIKLISKEMLYSLGVVGDIVLD